MHIGFSCIDCINLHEVSLGAERNFDFRRKDGHMNRYSINLQHGSLLLMKGDLQLYREGTQDS